MGRTCALTAVVLALVGCSAAAGSVADSGLAGRVVAGPTCPVEQVPPQPQCAPRAIAASLRVQRVGSTRAVTIRSRSDGHFRLALAPGTYEVRALPRASSPFPRPPAPFTVRVRAHHFTSVTVTYDTGIR